MNFDSLLSPSQVADQVHHKVLRSQQLQFAFQILTCFSNSTFNSCEFSTGQNGNAWIGWFSFQAYCGEIEAKLRLNLLN
jgi:hypothetical protein